MTIGSEILRLRKHRGWSQAELARRIGVSPSTIGAYETGRRVPDDKVLAAIAAALESTVEALRRASNAIFATPSIVTARAAEITGEIDLRVASEEAQVLLAMRMNPRIKEFVIQYTRASDSEREQLERTLNLIQSFHGRAPS